MGSSLAPPVSCANTGAPIPSPIIKMTTSPIARMTTDIAARPFRAALLLVFVAPPFMAALFFVFVAPPFMAALFFAMNLHMATHLPCILVPAQPRPHPLAIAPRCQLANAYHAGGRSFSSDIKPAESREDAWHKNRCPVVEALRFSFFLIFQ